jgi:membrane fusion protein, multidrug efflux system
MPEISAEQQEKKDQTHSPRPFYKRRIIVIAAALAALVGVAIGVRYWLYARSHESTDDAFIEGHVIQISPKASGYVKKVYVDDNQMVRAGDLIVELDARDYEARLQQARAALDAGIARQGESRTNLSLTRATSAAAIQQAKAVVQRARSTVESTRAGASGLQSRATQAAAAISTAEANVAQAQAEVVAREAELHRVDDDAERYRTLYAKDEISKQLLDQTLAAQEQARARLVAAQQRVAATTAQVNEARAAEAAATENARQAQLQIVGAQASVGEAAGRLAQANTAPEQIAVSSAQVRTAVSAIERLQADVDQAELELSYTKIYASEDGRVTRKAVEEGALVQIGQPLLAIVPGEVWVIANFKESQIGRMVPGQTVAIAVDAYPHRVFKGHVDSIQAGTGARFSLIPPENATGNYVKVVQRVPVKIVFDEPPGTQHVLAPGMSVLPEVSIK